MKDCYNYIYFFYILFFVSLFKMLPFSCAVLLFKSILSSQGSQFQEIAAPLLFFLPIQNEYHTCQGHHCKQAVSIFWPIPMGKALHSLPLLQGFSQLFTLNIFSPQKLSLSIWKTGSLTSNILNSMPLDLPRSEEFVYFLAGLDPQVYPRSKNQTKSGYCRLQ